MGVRAQVLIALVSFSSWLFILRLVRRRQLRAKYALLWVSVGTVMVILAAIPQVLDKVSRWLGIVYGPATLFFAANTLLLLIAVHFSWELSRLEERTRTLAEELAVFQAEKSLDRDRSGGELDSSV